ncbi:hypothetical protein MPNT_40158 [Candidatus Methylacidithermus pantelleriae]|uniref:Uncharacterized protein n=1 Tax=Candidatus Methylacidithermus pantelleriae TaxID=2744239 RepID=A0A8J2BRF0_9BACT|nr:hypothetical protein MPNT_40158 [Candidatus Methylacidithermus pantelleriae]
MLRIAGQTGFSGLFSVPWKIQGPEGFGATHLIPLIDSEGLAYLRHCLKLHYCNRTSEWFPFAYVIHLGPRKKEE